MAKDGSLTVIEMDNLVKETMALREEYEQASAVSKKKKEVYDNHVQKVISVLKKNDRTSWKNNHGRVTVAQRFFVEQPKTQEDKKAFFDYLAEKDLYWGMVGVNSTTLSSWYKKEMDAAVKDGADDFEVPGIKETGVKESLRVSRS
jgi:hypothetical protein